MSPDSAASTDGSTVLNSSRHNDARVAAFCSSLHPGLFHAIAYGTDIWRQDPFDVKLIHESVRETSRIWSIACATRPHCLQAGSCCYWAIPEAVRRT